MGSDVKEFANRSVGGGNIGDPVIGSAFQDNFGGSEYDTNYNASKFFDPLDLFGFRASNDIYNEAQQSKQRIVSMMRSANTMRQDVLASIKERDLRASEAAAKARREAQRRTGRASTILSR